DACKTSDKLIWVIREAGVRQVKMLIAPTIIGQRWHFGKFQEGRSIRSSRLNLVLLWSRA
ncbi:MAG: hypothetical protein MI748_20740, partial [Opitutales bacterium]|nr:hypothetical protein [Opitutales bacterium]